MSDKDIVGWRKLGNAGKIFPCATSKADTKVFRFSAQLFEDISPAQLQIALDKTFAQFPSFKSVLKRGLFWYYLEETNRPFIVHEENTPPCTILYEDSSSSLIDVSYYKKRITIEIYHALTDGAGALQFLKTLTYNYLLLVHKDELADNCDPLDFDASTAQREDDAFAKYYTGKKNASITITKKEAPVFYLKGAKTQEWRLKVIEGVMPTDLVIKKAKELDVSVTALLTAVLIRSIYKEMGERDKKKLVAVSIPISLHSYFPTKTVHNFFSVANIGYCFDDNSIELPDIARHVKAKLKETVTEEYLQQRLDTLTQLENIIFTRILPLFLKNLILKQFYLRSEKQYTTTLSNIGKANMPAQMCKYIDRIVAFNSTKDIQACVCTFENKITVAFTSRLESNDIPRRFFRRLANMGIPVEICTNQVEKEGEE